MTKAEPLSGETWGETWDEDVESEQWMSPFAIFALATNVSGPRPEIVKVLLEDKTLVGWW